MPRFSARFPVGILALLLGLAGCGQPATEKQCREILRRAAELELRAQLGKGNEDIIDEKLDTIEERMREPMMKQCVGKRITEGTLQCIRRAETSEALVNDCFR